MSKEAKGMNKTGVIEVWEEWTAPFPGANPPWCNEYPGSPSCDRMIHELTVVPTLEFREGKRPEEELEIRIADKMEFRAPIAMLMEAHESWIYIGAIVEKIVCHELGDVFKNAEDLKKLYELKVPILISRSDLVDVRLYRNGELIDSGSTGEKGLYTVCIKMLQKQDVH